VGDKEFFYAYLPEFLDGELSEELNNRFQNLMKKPEFQNAAQNYRSQRGLLQVHLGKLALNSDKIHDLRLKVRSDELEEAIEGAEIQHVKIEEAPKAQVQRWLVASIVLMIATAFLYTYLAKRELSFDPVQALPYEALMMEEDTDLSALDLPSTDPREIKVFFDKHKDFNFTPFVLKISSPWQMQGASVIDYDFAKIGVVRIQNSDRKQTLFQFAFAGRLEELSPSSQGRLNNFVYQTYASDQINLIVWQYNAQTLGMLVGHIAADELAQIAENVPPIH